MCARTNSLGASYGVLRPLGEQAAASEGSLAFEGCRRRSQLCRVSAGRVVVVGGGRCWQDARRSNSGRRFLVAALGRGGDMQGRDDVEVADRRGRVWHRRGRDSCGEIRPAAVPGRVKHRTTWKSYIAVVESGAAV